jgi:hypothetical protein
MAYDQRARLLHMVMADGGIGIRASLVKRYPEAATWRHGEAIERALGGLSSRPSGGGAGLRSVDAVVRRYTGPFGSAEVFHSRALPATELLIVPRDRVKVVPYRDWQFVPIAKTGDNEKAMLVGEHTVEVHHPNAMARLRV